jgi:D-glycero-beta-D-manno-heptose 1-phosphate adenylyltransferase
MSHLTNSDKVLTKVSDLAGHVTHFRRGRKKIVLTQGSFDMVHIGHARYCEKAKSYGDVLIVGVDSDEKIKQRKGPDRPVVPQEERLEMLTYLRAVDLVVLKEINAPKYLIKTVRPDVLVATQETYSPAQLEALKEFCGKVVVLEPMATTSTSAKIRRLQIVMAKKMSETLSAKLIQAIEDAFKELKGESL